MQSKKLPQTISTNFPVINVDEVIRKQVSNSTSDVLQHYQKIFQSENLGLIAFKQTSCSDLLEHFQGTTIPNYENEWYTNENFWSQSLPRKGICIMSNTCIPNSYNMDLMNQTLLLVRYTEKIFPEILKTEFWEIIKQEVLECEKKIKTLNCTYQENRNKAIELLHSLQVNKYFRPSFTELYQQAIAFSKTNLIKLYEDRATGTNTIWSNGSNRQNLVVVGPYRNGNLEVSLNDPEYRHEKTGCSFICDLDWISSII